MHPRGTRGRKIGPLCVIELGGDDGLFPSVSLVHQLEEGIALLCIEREVTQFVDEQQIVPCEPTEEPGCERSVGSSSPSRASPG